jgi:predicted nucleic-acid-binding protein
VNGIDTNVLLRYVLKDDAGQARAAADFIDRRCSTGNPALVADVVLAETVWFASRRLRRSRAQICQMLLGLVDNAHLAVFDEGAVLAAINAYAEGPGDFADYLVAATNRAHGAAKTFTFDEKAARNGALTLLTMEV